MRRIKKMNKKGVSPIVATMLLIGIVVVLAVLIFLWLRGFTREVITKNLGFGEKNIELVCEDIVLNANYNSVSGRVEISNQGSAPIKALEIKRTYIDGQYDKIRITDGSGEEVSLKQGRAISPMFSTLGDEYVKRLLIIPVLLGNAEEGGTEEYVCDENYGVEVYIQ